MAPGRPCKKPRNTSGLRNQPDRLSPLPGSHLTGIESDGTAPHSTPSRSCSRAPSPDDQYFPDRHDLANSKVGSEIDQDEYRYRKTIKKTFQDAKDAVQNTSMPVPQRSFTTLWIGHGDLWVRIDVDWQGSGERLHGLSESKNNIDRFLGRRWRRLTLLY